MQNAVQRSFQAGHVEGRRRLLDVLRRIMLRSSKADLRLPPLSRKVEPPAPDPCLQRV